MQKTSIGWTDYSWNPVTGCHKVSRGCKNCYAETLTKRFGERWGMKSFRDVKMWPERLWEPLNIAQKLVGKKVFVCDMSDLFHEDVTDSFIFDVFETIHNLPDTTFQILTKRPQRAIDIFKRIPEKILVDVPFKNVWIGVSCEDQQTASDRIPLLKQIPAEVRFISFEPLVGHIYTAHLRFYEKEIHWAIVGGESGHGAQPMHPDWVRSLRDQCKAAGVPFFFKQWGEYMPYETIEPGEVKINRIKMADPKAVMYRVGKSKSGNLLDGVQHLNFPK